MMTLYEFMQKFGKYIKFYICEFRDFEKHKILEKKDKISLFEIETYKEDYPALCSALEREAIMFDLKDFIIYID